MKTRIVLAAAFAFIICSGATCPPQVTQGLINIGTCLGECGVGAASNAIHQEMGGAQSIDGAAIGWGALDCVMTCAGKQGVVSIIDAVAGATKDVSKYDKAVPPTFRLYVEPKK